MRHWTLFTALVAIVAFAGCKHNPPQPPATASRPAAPGAPPPAPAPARAPEVAPQVDEYAKLKGTPADEIDRMGLLADIHFDFDKSDLREGDRQILTKNAEVLKRFDFLRITVEGHCDERGTVEYNLALGERRSRAAYDYLVSLGVGKDRLKTVSYGKEIQVCHEATEECWARNRRDRFTVTGKAGGR
jgi:peptidoglycan-associated lipoprotein